MKIRGHETDMAGSAGSAKLRTSFNGQGMRWLVSSPDRDGIACVLDSTSSHIATTRRPGFRMKSVTYVSVQVQPKMQNQKQRHSKRLFYCKELADTVMEAGMAKKVQNSKAGCQEGQARTQGDGSKLLYRQSFFFLTEFLLHQLCSEHFSTD